MAMPSQTQEPFLEEPLYQEPVESIGNEPAEYSLSDYVGATDDGEGRNLLEDRPPRNLLEDTQPGPLPDQDDWVVLPESGVLWDQAPDYVGQNALVCGRVVNTNYAEYSAGTPTFLDLGRSYPDPSRVSIVIWGDYLWNFSGNLLSLRGEFICVDSEPYWYGDVVQMELWTPEQLLVRTP